MQVYKIDGAICAISKKVLQVIEPRRSRRATAGVRHSGSTKQGLTRKWLDELLVRRDGSRDVHASRPIATQIRFVEGEEGRGTSVNRKLCSLGPGAGQTRIVVVQHWHKLDG